MRGKIQKRWAVNVMSAGHEPLRIFCDGQPLIQSSKATIDNVSPVEHLLIAAATCFAHSCRAILARRRITRVAFEIVVTGTKAARGPTRIGQIAVVALFRGGITDAQAVETGEDAARLCTVTNTLLGVPSITISARTLKTADNAVVGWWASADRRREGDPDGGSESVHLRYAAPGGHLSSATPGYNEPFVL